MSLTEKKGNINVLVISKSSWNQNSAFGNTLSNFFGDSPNLSFYNVYLRNQIPENDICIDYFNISNEQIVKNAIFPWKIGNYLNTSYLNNKREERQISKFAKMETKITNFSKKHLFSFLRLIEEIIWVFGGWKNKKFRKYLISRNIDVIFASATDPIYLQSVVSYCQHITKAKLVLFFADDTYTYKGKSPFSLIYQSFIRKTLRKTVESSSIIYGASQKLCDEYKKNFNRDIIPLYKGCLLNDNIEVNKSYSYPLKIVYAGNLLYGRDDILTKLANEIMKINQSIEKINLEIYTTTNIDEKVKRNLNIDRTSRIMGFLPYEEIKKVLNNADIVLHVESFKPNQVKKTRLSFSTKIIDCMQSGSCMMAIGPHSIASIEYLLGIDAVISITDPSKIGHELEKIVSNPDSLKLKSEKLAKFARENHDIKDVRYKLEQDFLEIIGNKRNQNRG